MDSEQHWDATLYAQNNQIQGQLTNRFFFNIYQWRGNETVLDIGSGDGKLTARIAKSTPNGEVRGWDNSLSMIEHAQKYYQSSNLIFEMRDANVFNSYADRRSYFDLVVSFHALHWMDNQLAALQGIAHVLKPGGTAYLFVTSDGFDPILILADALAKKLKWSPHFKDFQSPLHRFSVQQYTELLEQAGLIPHQVIEIAKTDPLSSKKDLEDQIISWLPHLKVLPPSLHAEFVNEMVEEYMNWIFPDQDEPAYLADCNLEVIAQKPLE